VVGAMEIVVPEHSRENLEPTVLKITEVILPDKILVLRNVVIPEVLLPLLALIRVRVKNVLVFSKDGAIGAVVIPPQHHNVNVLDQELLRLRAAITRAAV